MRSLRSAVVAAVLAASVTGCSFVRSSKLHTCGSGAPALVDVGVTLASLAVTGFYWDDGVGKVTIPIGAVFFVSSIYGGAKVMPPSGTRCQR
jgi:hypothetical protein